MKKIVLFGAGRICRTFMGLYDNTKVEILAIVDNNSSLWETKINGIEVCGPDEMKSKGFDYIVVTSSHFVDIEQQIIASGFSAQNIVNFYTVFQRLSMQDSMINEMLRNDVFLSITTQIPYEMKFQEAKDLQVKNLFLSAKNYINAIYDKEIDSLDEVEFQVFSQFGEDGIIQWLIHNVRLNEKTFVEFGVEDYTEANTKFLLMNNNWTGLVIDGNSENINRVKRWKYFWKYDLTAIAKFITKDNINQIISDAGFSGDIGLLSVDIDGNDYWILNAIDCIRPRILICEYNNIFGPDKKVTVPYDDAFYRTEKHYSNLYWGASLGAFCDWAIRNEYYYIGSNSAGNNAFFVRMDCVDKSKIPTKSGLFNKSKYRESRDENGCLTFLRGMDRLKIIKEMEVVDLSNGYVRSIADIYYL